jgi:lipopolysaccharide transport system ATP-binding protein
MTDAVLAVSGLYKRYCRSVRRGAYYALRDIAGEMLRSKPDTGLRPEEFWAVRDISFDLRAGEALGIIGHNGAGKSTLLKLLYGLIKPDRGEIRIKGRAEALIELGAAFNSALTGRENIELAAAMSGLGARERGRLLDRVVDFAELDGVIGSPMLSYSSGMRARLAFAVSLSLDPDLLLIDEALAVGDAAFQRKCMNAMHGYVRKGGALLFVSHNAHQVQALCSRAILLDEGRLTFQGGAVEAVSKMLSERCGSGDASDDEADPDKPIRIERLSVAGEGGNGLLTGNSARVSLLYRAREAVEVRWGFNVTTRDQSVFVTGSSDLGAVRLEPGRGELSCVIPNLPLVPGLYMLRAAINEADSDARLASCGWSRPGALMKVDAAASLLTNAQVHLGQLVTLDVDWGRS